MNAQPLLNEAQRRAPRALVEHALILLGRMHHGSDVEARDSRISLDQWRAASPDNAHAAETAERIWNSTAATDLQGTLVMPQGAQQQQRARRRQIVGTLGFAGLAALLAGGTRWYWQQPLATLALSTTRGQQLTRDLADGTQVQLGADTALQITLWRHKRLVHMSHGEARFTVAHDTDRPFVVQTPMGRVQVLGTVFSVSLRPSGLHIAVEQGRVGVWSSTDAQADISTAPQQVLGAGEWLLLGGDAHITQGTTAPQTMADWTRGWLVFDNTPLPDAIARWNAYLRTPLRMNDGAQLANLHVSGSYRIADPQAFVNSLPQMLPVRTSIQHDGTVQIAKR